jgi:release factor glutamine methyltransferase
MQMTASEAIRAAAAQLAAVSGTPRLDAELLMAHALGCSRSALLLRAMREPVPEAFAALLARRLGHEPVAYIRGRQAFYGLQLAVAPGVLIPRGDSETLIDAARAAFSATAPTRILDLGAGSGALLLAALSLWPEAEAVGLDRSPRALAVARGNGERLGLRARWLERDWQAPDWARDLGRFDLILANPPYVEANAELAPSVRDHEPPEALFAGADGLDAYRALVPQLPGLLAPGGVAIVEIGHTQAEAVTALAAAAGLAAALHRDLGGRPRALQLKNSLGKTGDPHCLGGQAG